ncbi:hypothetical protein D3C76_1495230 [compost metagenome]
MVDLAGVRHRPDPARIGPAHVLHHLVRHRCRTGLTYRTGRPQPAPGHAGTAVGSVLLGHHVALVQAAQAQAAGRALDRRQRDR